MPIYQYECKGEQCGEKLEEIQSIKAEPLTKCPKCGQETLARVICAPGLVFKGSGFYVNDYPKNDRGVS
jgi:putative FmdB family regulatory protein